MATPMQVQDALDTFLRQRVADCSYVRTLTRNIAGEETITRKKPKIVTGFLIPQTAKSKYDNDESEDFPYIGTRILNVNHAGTKAVISMKIMFGLYCPGSEDPEGKIIEDASGYRDLLNLMEAARIAIFTERLIGQICSINEFYYKQEIPEDQPYPYWEGWFFIELQASIPVSMTGLIPDNYTERS